MITRRSFLQQTALVGAGALISPVFASAKPFKNIGIQLYSLREEIVKDTKGVLARVAKSGYKDVETYGYPPEIKKYWNFDAKSFKLLLDDYGLKSTSGHYDFSQLINTGKYDDVKTYLEAAAIVGQKNIVLPSLSPASRSTSDKYKAIADKMNSAAELCRAAGVNFCYHNHDFEFEKLPDGNIGYDILLNNTNPDVKFEMDLYWVAKAGLDPVVLFKKFPGRFKMWHVKDMSKQDRSLQTEVGNGSINFKEIFAHAKLAGTERFFIEQENNYVPDTFTSIAQSASYVSKELM